MISIQTDHGLVHFRELSYHCKLWLSDEAHSGIIKLATKVHCSALMGIVLGKLPADPRVYYDARPDELTDLDLPLLEAGMFPTWTMEFPLRPIDVSLSTRVQTKLLTISLYWHITKNQEPISYRSPQSRIGATVEAIGTGLLDFNLTDPVTSGQAPTGENQPRAVLT